MNKPCCTCKEIKPITEFYKNKSRSDGRSENCKACQLKAAKKYYLNGGKEKQLQYNRQYKKRDYVKAKKKILDTEYRKTRAGKVTMQKAFQKYRKTNPDKITARHIVDQAVSDNKFPVPDFCMICHTTEKVEYHHHKGYELEDYFAVIPLCHTCHIEIHNELKIA